MVLRIDLNDRSQSAASQTVDRLESKFLFAIGLPLLNSKSSRDSCQQLRSAAHVARRSGADLNGVAAAGLEAECFIEICDDVNFP